MNKQILLFAAAALCLAACTKPELTLNGSSDLEVAVTGGSASLTFTSTMDWTAQANDSWVHVSPASGKGSNAPVTVTLTCDPNTTYDDRSTTVTISSEGLKQMATLRQGANGGLIVTTQSFEVGAAATTIEVAVQANVAFSAQCSANWIKQTGTKALSESKLVFSIEENTSFEERNATITISGSGLSQTVTVKQAAAENIAKDLYGTWLYSGCSLVLDEDGTWTQTEYETVTKGTWSYDGTNLTRTPEGGTEADVARVLLIGGKAWMVLVYESEDEFAGATRRFDSYIKSGATVESGTLGDGRWDAPYTGYKPADYTGEADYNLCLEVKGNTMDLYMPVWGFHIQGTFTLTNGKFHLDTDKEHIWKAVTINDQGDEGGSIGWLAGNMNSETFELTEPYGWYTIKDLMDMGKKPDSSDPEYQQYPYKFKFLVYEFAENQLSIAEELCDFDLCVAEDGENAYGNFVGLGKWLYKR